MQASNDHNPIPSTSIKILSHAQGNFEGIQCYVASRDQHIHTSPTCPKTARDILLAASAIGALYNSRDRETKASECTPKTRIVLLDKIQHWLDDTKGSGIFWINGPPGIGKSCIAQTVARYFERKGRLAASFFFDRGAEKRNTTTHFIPTISYQLTDPSLATFNKAILDTLEATFIARPHIFHLNISEQINELIFQPLENMQSSLQHSIVIIDALDECHSDLKAMERFVSQIASMAQTLCSPGYTPLRFLITSRNEDHIKRSFNFKGIGPNSFIEVSLSGNDSKDDIRIFLTNRMKGKVDDGLLESLIVAAGGLFIYASIIDRFMEEANYEISAGEMLAQIKSRSFRRPLYALYNQILLKSTYHDANSSTHAVVNTIIHLFNPLSLQELDTLVQFKSREALRSLRSVFVIPSPGEYDKPVEIYHSTFQEYLEEEHASTMTSTHGYIAMCCLNLMVKNSDSNVATSGALWYACRFWASHFARASAAPGIDNSKLTAVLNEFVISSRFVRWMEADPDANGIMNIHDIMEVLVNSRKLLDKGGEEYQTAVGLLLKVECPVAEHFFSPCRLDDHLHLPCASE